MRYQDRDSGKEIELSIIIGCPYWETSSGEIYAVDRSKNYAWPVRPGMALKHILLRAEMRRTGIEGDCEVCEIERRKSNPESFRGHAENYLKNYVDK